MSELWLHQKEGVRRAVDAAYADSSHGFGYFYDTGTGKSRTLVETLRQIYAKHERVLPTVIVTPLITLNNWKNEILKYSKIPESQILLLKGSGAQKLALLKKYPNKSIIVLNYESLLNTEIKDSLWDKLASGDSALVCDESHYCKNPTSKRTKAVHQLVKAARFRFCLSGTPILNSHEDVWSQAYILDRGYHLGEKFHYFKLKFFEDKNRGMPKAKYFPNWVVKQESIKYFEEVLSKISMSVKKSECLDLPDLVVSELEVEMCGEQKLHYEKVRKEYITYVNDAACVASIAIVKALRLQQIASGYMPLDDDTVHKFKENPKLDALEQYVDLHVENHKIIIWACFKQNHEDICKMLENNKIKFVRLTGEESAEEKFKAIADFDTDKTVRVCVANQSVGIGFNMVASSMSIYYSVNFNLGQDIQSEARNYRSGSEIHQSVHRVNIICTDALDRQIHQALSDKKKIGAEILKEFLNG